MIIFLLKKKVYLIIKNFGTCDAVRIKKMQHKTKSQEITTKPNKKYGSMLDKFKAALYNVNYKQTK